MGSNIIIDSINKLSNEYKLSELWELGFSRNPSSYYFSVNFPPSSLSSKAEVKNEDFLNSVKVFSDNNAIYLHFPFCSRKCHFCPYCTIPSQDESTIHKYIQALISEISIASVSILNGKLIKAIYIGGGTPSLMRLDDLEALFISIHKNFILADNCEFSFEIHPEIVKRSDFKRFVDILISYRVNRISIGVQSFSDLILKKNNRGHSSLDAIKLIEELKKHASFYLNIDLLNGLPYQTIDTWLFDLETIRNLRPNGFTTYSLEIRNWVNAYNDYKNEPFKYPNEYLIHLFYIMAKELSDSLFFEENPKMYFSESKDNFLYATKYYANPQNSNVIGLGLSSYSFSSGWQYFNTVDLTEYFQFINRLSLPIISGNKLAIEDSISRTLIMNLRFKSKINIKELNTLYNLDLFQKYSKAIYFLIENGLMEFKDQTYLNITNKGGMFIDEICTLFISESSKEMLRNSGGIYDRFYLIK